MLERITQEELTNIDLDIFSSMKKIPNNENYNSLYVRWDKSAGNTFCRILCNAEDFDGLLAILLFEEKREGKEGVEEAEDRKLAILNLAINILKEKPVDEVDYFLQMLSIACKKPSVLKGR